MARARCYIIVSTITRKRQASKLFAPEQVLGLDKNTLTALFKLASSDKDRTLLKFAACEAAGLTSQKAWKVYGIGSYKDLSRKLCLALQEALDFRQSVIELAEIDDKALMSLRLEDVINEEGEDNVDFEACELMSTNDALGPPIFPFSSLEFPNNPLRLKPHNMYNVYVKYGQWVLCS